MSNDDRAAAKWSRIANRLSVLIGFVWLIYISFRFFMHCDLFPTIGPGVYCNWKQFEIYYSPDFEPTSASSIMLAFIGPPVVLWGILRGVVWVFRNK
jgi:hypothetical protein